MEGVKTGALDCLSLLSRIENPAFVLLNDKHTVMIRDGVTYILVFMKSAGREAFVKCNIEKSGIDILDSENAVFTEFFDEYRDSKRIDKGLGVNMFSI